VTAQFRTTLAENINLMASSSLSIYGLSEQGTTVSELAISQGKGLFRMTNFTTSVDLDLGRLLQRKDKDRQQTSSGAGQEPGGQRQEGDPSGGNLPLGNREYDEYGYARFDVPWSLRMAYNFNYSKPAFKSDISQTMTLSGDLRLTPKMAINYSTGYDFSQHEITMSRVGISRDLHCWEMNFSWIPIGYMKSWNFTIRAKAGLLHDLKYERKKDYHENF
jgi:lipopolysaccharide assembly outer membrane protein LptD (OstA)